MFHAMFGTAAFPAVHIQEHHAVAPCVLSRQSSNEAPDNGAFALPAESGYGDGPTGVACTPEIGVAAISAEAVKPGFMGSLSLFPCPGRLQWPGFPRHGRVAAKAGVVAVAWICGFSPSRCDGRFRRRGLRGFRRAIEIAAVDVIVFVRCVIRACLDREAKQGAAKKGSCDIHGVLSSKI